jgi:hypothetical protein
MQRLGFCKAVLVFCEQARTSGQMANMLRTRLGEQKFTVPYDESFAAWLKSIGNTTESKPEISTSLQKLYIFGHPSRAGWLSKRGFDEYADYLPQKLGLVTDTYRPSDMGLVLSRALIAPEQREALRYPSSSNPLVLSQAEQMFFLYNLFSADGDFLLPFCGAILDKYYDEIFSYLDAGSVLPDTIGTILSSFSGSGYTPLDRDIIRRLRLTREQVLEDIREERHKEGSGSKREQITITRLEWLVDLGIVNKVDSRRWRFTALGLQLADLLRAYRTEMKRKYPENVVPALLDSYFFAFVGRAYDNRDLTPADHEQFLAFISPAYSQLVGVAGYCLLRPLLLCANIQSILSHQDIIVEYNEASKLLEGIFQSDPSILHYTINRFSTDYQVRIRKLPK